MATSLPKKKLSKSKLSLYLRTQCDKELYLSLFNVSAQDMAAAGLPAPLKSRPNVQLVTGAGNAFENAQFQMLVARLSGHVRHAPSFNDIDLLVELPTVTSPTLCIQPAIEPEAFRTNLLNNLGVSSADQASIPVLAGMRPDLILVDQPVVGDWEVLPNGSRKRIDSTESRQALSVIDLKNVTEGNASYAAEVCLYAVVLANWLVHHGLTGKYYISEKIYLWTTPFLAEFEGLFKAAPTTPKPALIAALRKDLEREAVDFLQFVPSVKKFFAQDVPRVVSRGDTLGWQAVDIHVGSRCNACDWLGNRDWLSPVDQALYDANPNHYCVPSTKACGHLSQIANLSRGARKVLEANGTKDVASLQALPATDPTLSRHSFLKKHRNGLSGKAGSLITNTNSPGLTSKVTSLAKGVELRACAAVTFDSSAGRLTGIGFRADVLPPYGHAAALKHLKYVAYMVERNTDDAEWIVLKQFIDDLVDSAVQAAKHLDPGNAKPKLPYAQVYFWEYRQYEELCKAFGRHLPRILSLPDSKQRALAWLFPPDDLLERDDGAISPAIVFVQDIVERAMNLPVAHVYTLLATVAVYHHPKLPPISGVDTFYSEPLSNGIPRERTFEIWTNTSGVVQWGKSHSLPLSKAVDRYCSHLKVLAYSLNSIVAKLDQDFRSALKGKAKRLELSGIGTKKGLAFDSQLWAQWSLLEHATASTEAGAALGASHEELEARYEAIVLTNMLANLGGNRYRFKVSSDSLEAKFDAPDRFLTIGVVSRPGFPLENGYSLNLTSIDPLLQPQELRPAMHKIIKASLLAFDRAAGEAEVEIAPTYSGVASTFNAVVNPGVVNIATEQLYLVKGAPWDGTEEIKEVLDAIGDPKHAKPDPNAVRALGKFGKTIKPGADAPTTASRVLWDAPTLSKAAYRSNAAAKALAADACKIALRPLNASQVSAVEGAAKTCLSLIWGPPGTGKTDTLAALLHAVIREAISLGKGAKILVTGPNYRAVEVLADRLLDLLARDPSATCDFFRAYSKSRELPPSPSLPPHINGQNVSLQTSAAGYSDLSTSLNTTSVITLVATSAHAAKKVAALANSHDVLAPVFDMVVIDESSQVPVTLSLLPISTLKVESQLVVAGDPLQMPPIASLDPPTGSEYLVGSIHSYLKERFKLAQLELLENYRSNQCIVDYALTLGYPAQLKAARPNLKLKEVTPRAAALASLPPTLPVSTAWEQLLDPDRAVCTLIHEDDTASQANPEEAKMVAALVWGLYRTMSVELEPLPSGKIHQAPSENELFERVVGIVTPHKAQRALILNELMNLFPTVSRDIMASAIDTVEKFQGGQRQTIIVSFGVGDVDIIEGEEFFLLQLERINVSVSRAEAKCIVVLPKSLAYHLPSERKTVKTAKAIKSYLETFCNQRQMHVTSFAGGATRDVEVRWHQ
jgi:hypothetical protein